MMTGLSFNALKKMLEHLYEMTNYIERAIVQREKLYEMTGETENDMTRNEKYDPSQYYQFRIKNKAVYIDIVLNQRDKTKKYYGIRINGWKPNRLIKVKYETWSKTYGLWTEEEFEDCKKAFKEICADLLYENGFNIYESVELFY